MHPCAYPSMPNVCLSQHLCPILCPLKLILVHPAKEKQGSAPGTNPAGPILPPGCAKASSCSRDRIIYSSVSFAPSLAGKEQTHPFPASGRMCFCHTGDFLQCYRGEGGSPLSLSSSASPGFCTIKQLPCSTSELLATQQKKRKKRKTGEKKGGLAEEKVDKYHKTLEKTDRPPLVNSCALLWHRPH